MPTEQVVEVRRGRKINSERKFFPGYVLVNCDLTDDIYHLIKNTPKVTGFLGADKKPMPISDAEADRIKGQVAEGVDRPKSSISFRDRRDGARRRRALRLLQRRRRGSRRGPLAGQGRGVDLRPGDARRTGISLRSKRSEAVEFGSVAGFSPLRRADERSAPPAEHRARKFDRFREKSDAQARRGRRGPVAPAGAGVAPRTRNRRARSHRPGELVWE